MGAPDLWSYAIVGASFALYIGIALWARAASTGDFYVAGGGVHPIANGMATAADWFSAASFLSLAGMIALDGYGGSAFLMGWTGGHVLLALLLVPALRRFGGFTVPEFVAARYDSRTARLLAVLCLLLISLTYLLAQMSGIGIAFARFLDLPHDTALLVGMGIVIVYAMLGGMKSITYTQIAQYVLILFAYSVPAIFLSLQLTGNPVPQLGLGDAWLGDPGGMPLLARLDQAVTDLGFSAYTTSVLGSPLNMIALTLSLMIGTAGLPHVIARFFTVPRVADARLAAGWALLFIALLYTTAPALGAMTRLNLLASIQTGPVGAPAANLPYAERPDWFRHWERTGLLRFEDKNGDGRIQYYDDTNPAFTERAAALGWRGNELTRLDSDILMLASPEIARLPGWAIALAIAGALAAVLATSAGLLLAIASTIAHDLLKGLVLPGISEKGELLAGRLAMLGSILLASALALHPPGSVADTVALAFGLAGASLFPVLLLGVFSTRLNAAGAIAGMVTGLAVTLLYVFQHKGLFFIPDTAFLRPDLGLGAHWFLGIAPEAFGAVGAAANLAVALLVARLTAPPPERIRHLVEDLRVPRAAGTRA